MATAMTRWSPMSEMMTLREAMERLFTESMVPSLSNLTQQLESTLPIDMYEENDQLVVKTSMPGVKPDDINIDVRDNVLTITGEVKTEQPTQQGAQGNGDQQPKSNGQNWYMRERQYARFVRAVALPFPVQSDKAEATIENGVLTLRLPKAEQAKQKKIPVKTK